MFVSPLIYFSSLTRFTALLLFYYTILFPQAQMLERLIDKEKIDKSINFYLFAYFL
jgi:hypothetical protein